MAFTAELEAAERRLARMIDQRADEEAAQARADADARRVADAREARERAELHREHQARYADAFASFGSLPPPPIEGERPGAYRKRLFEHLRNRLPTSHPMFEVRADDIPAGPAVRNFEQMLLQAAVAEGSQPSPENLPRDGSMVTRIRSDPDSGTRRTEFFGRESFIKQLSLAPKRVAALCTSRGNVFFGQPRA